MPIEDEPGQLTYTFVAMIDGVEVRGDGTIESEAWYPNGPACSARFARADLELGIDGEVRPAEA